MDRPEYIVVGAGTAGCAVAARLSEDPKIRVVLLEAGGGDEHPYLRMPAGFLQALRNPDLTWGYTTEPEPFMDNRVLPLPRGKVLGGSSSINGMIHIRGNPRDFDSWRDDAGATGWGYDDVLPYFRRSETSWLAPDAYHGALGPVEVNRVDSSRLFGEQIRASAAAQGFDVITDYDGVSHEGMAEVQVAIGRDGRRSSAARGYIRPNLKRRNLTVITRAATRRVVIEDGRAVAVDYVHKGREVRLHATREIILCGGTYNSPQLLMLSGIGPAADLKALGITPVVDLPGVGRNLQEHPRMPLQFEASGRFTFVNQLRLDRAAGHVLNWALFGKGPFASQVCSGILLMKTRPDLAVPDIQLLFSPTRIDANLWFPGLTPPQSHCFYTNVCQLRPYSRGQVTLRSPDPAAPPRIQLNLLSDPRDYDSLRDGIRIARRLFATEPQNSLVGKEMIPGAAVQTDADFEKVIRQWLGVTHHPVGTCAMGSGGASVVDEHLRVRGVAGLRVADASIMPTIVGANTNACALMIGEKAADLIKGTEAITVPAMPSPAVAASSPAEVKAPSMPTENSLVPPATHDFVANFLKNTGVMPIDGAWVPAASGATLDIVNPADGTVIARAPAGDAADIARAVEAARRALEGPWSKLKPADRQLLLLRFADLLEKHAAELALLETLDVGIPFMQAWKGAVPHAIMGVRYTAGWATKLYGETRDVSLPGEWHTYTLRQPVGVCALITPWNAPLGITLNKIVPALAAGCTVVLKPAELTPLNALFIGRLIEEAGFPAGVVNIVTGLGTTAGTALISHPLVDKIAFTGSTAVGKQIIQASAATLKRISVELGGKSPVFVFPDADIDRAVDMAARSIFGNTGQVCAAGSRLYAHKDIFDRVIEGIADCAAKLRVGPGVTDVDMGPVVSDKQLDRVLDYIRIGREQGAHTVTGGGRINRPGYFIEPTVFIDTKPDMTIVREEIFGPVLVAQAFSDETIDQLAALGNDTIYGLSSNIYTRDLSKAHKLARRLKAGNVRINASFALDAAMPFGGFKQSGYGRESGREGVEAYTELKSVAMLLD